MLAHQLPPQLSTVLQLQVQQPLDPVSLAAELTQAMLLQVHAANRPIPREGGQGYESDALLHAVAERTIGYSGADLANLLNEASILSVSFNVDSEAPRPIKICV